MANNVFYDKDFRSKARNLDKESLAKLVASSAPEVKVKVLTDTKSTTYFVIPTDQGDYELESIQAGAFNTVGSLGSFGTIGTLCASTSSISSAGSVSTGGGE